MELCIDCHERPIHIKKRGLCQRCYLRHHARGEFSQAGPPKENRYASRPTLNKRELNGEFEFVKSYFKDGSWIYQPAIFKLNGQKYSPDFYDPARNVWIEVSSTRQAYHANKDKYQLFRELYPHLNFEIRKPTGELLNEDSRDKQWA